MGSITPLKGRCGTKLKRECSNCKNPEVKNRNLLTWDVNCPLCNELTIDRGYCESWPMKSVDKCASHGGKKEIQEKFPETPKSRWGKYLPPRLIDQYYDARMHQDVLVLTEDIALLEARISDLLRRVDSGESGKLWQKLDEAYGNYLTARNHKDTELMRDYLEDMHKIIKRGYHDYIAWNEITKLLEQKRKITDSERKRIVEAQQTISINRVMALVSSIEQIIRNNVNDKDTLLFISNDIKQLLSG